MNQGIRKPLKSREMNSHEPGHATTVVACLSRSLVDVGQPGLSGNLVDDKIGVPVARRPNPRPGSLQSVSWITTKNALDLCSDSLRLQMPA